MKLVRLRYFVPVAEELSFTRAAAKLRIAQPVLSRQIRTLENEVGVELLVRDGRAFKLTPAGGVLSEEAATILAQYGLATERAREAGNRSSVVRVGIGFGLGEYVGRVVTRHARSFADVHIRLQTIPSTAQNLALKRCEIDIGFLRPPVDPGHLSCHFLFDEHLSALVPAVSPFTRYKAVRLSQLANIPLLLPPRNLSSGLYDRVLYLYRGARPQPRGGSHASLWPRGRIGALARGVEKRHLHRLCFIGDISCLHQESKGSPTRRTGCQDRGLCRLAK